MIAIPSRGRGKRLLEVEGTLDCISAEYKKNTCLFIREEEIKEYEELANLHGCKLIARSNDLRIPEVRDLMISYASTHHETYLFMFDDDLQLCFKPNPNTYLKMEKGKYFSKMMHDLLYYLGEKYPIVGITARQFSQDKTDPYEVNTRIIQLMGLYLPTILKEQFSFSWGHPVMEDYNLLLTFLQKGYKNLCLNGYTRNDVPQSSGGCSEWRTVEIQNRAAMGLAKRFPGIVRPYVKTGQWNQRHINVRIQWKNAYVDHHTII